MAKVIQKLKYGAFITISSIAIITGTLWFNRTNQYIKTEDIAALYGRVTESIIAYQEGTGAVPTVAYCPWKDRYVRWYPGYTQNGTNFYNEYEGTGGVDVVSTWLDSTNNVVHNIHNFYHWSLVYDHILNSSRDMVLQNNHENNGLFWIDNIFNDQLSIVSGESNWSHTDTDPGGYLPISRVFSMSTPTNHFDQNMGTSDTRKFKDNVTRFRMGLQNNFPLVKYFFNSNVEATNNPPWDSWNWWTDKTANTNVYGYKCEHDEEPLDIVDIQSSQAYFTNNPAQLQFKYNEFQNEQTLTVYSKSSDTNHLYAQLFELVDTGRQSNYIVASDGDSDLTLPFVLSAKYAQVNEGNSVNISVKLAKSINTIYVIPVIVNGHGITITTSPYTGGSFIFGPNNWNENQTLTITAPEDSDKQNPAAIVSFALTNNYVFIAAGGSDNDGYSDDIRTSTTLLHMNKEGSASTNVRLGSPFTNFNFYTDQKLSTNLLNEAVGVLTNLNTTMKVYDYSDIIFNGMPTATVHTYSSYINNDDISDQSGGFTYSDDTWFDHLVSARSDVESKEEFSGIILDSYIHGSASQIAPTPSDDPRGYYSGENFTELSKVLKLDGECMVPYPSRYAYESNYVKSVKIYGVFKCSVAEPATWAGPFNPAGSASIITFNPDNCGVSWYSDHNGIALCASYGDRILLNNEDYSDTFSGTEFVSEYKISLLKSATNPTTIQTFEIGVNSWIPTKEYIHGSYTNWKYTYGTDNYDTRYDWIRRYHNTIQLLKIVVIVEWNFNYISPNFTVEPNNPTWASSQ